MQTEGKSCTPSFSDQLLDAEYRIGRQNEMISNAHRSVLESEEVGMEITSELARNREKIESSRAKVAVGILL
mgnify:CR=1 FL=1